MPIDRQRRAGQTAGNDPSGFNVIDQIGPGGLDGCSARMARILLIEDDADVRAVIQTMLQSRGHEVATAVDGEEGLRQFAAQPFDLVICDIFMPNMDGIGTLRELRRRRADLPIVVTSGGSPNVLRVNDKGNSDYLEFAKQLGAMATIAKPFTIKQLMDIVEAALDTAAPRE
jgi:CheY-like chemotaxis protein